MSNQDQDIASQGHVLLIGARASGKTTIGRLLADRLGIPFVDLDARALAALGCDSVREAWQQHGEPGWRRAELAALQRVMSDRRQVIALGGGTPTIPEAQQIIQTATERDAAAVIYLRCDPETLKRRLASDSGDRPSLTGIDPAEEIEAVVRERVPIYEGLATAQCDTGRGDPSQAVDQILQMLQP